MLAQLKLMPVWRMGEEFLNSFLPFVRLEWVSPPVRAALAYAFRTWVAGCTAMLIAFYCQLESPYWASIATWIASLPIPGMTVSKSIYRIIGSMLGAFIGVVLIALFAQSPELFILALALLTGGCTLASNVLRNFRSYASALTGYTAAIVALAAVDNPNQVFNIAMARGSCTVIGIICAIVVTRLFAPHKAREQVLLKLKTTLGDVAVRASFPLAGPASDSTYAFAYKLLADLISLDTEIEYAAAESSSFRIHANRAREQLAECFGVISAVRAIRSMEDEGGPVKLPAGLTQLRSETVDFLLSVPEAIAKDQLSQSLITLRDFRRRLAAENPEQSDEDLSCIVRQRLFIDHLDLLLEHLENAILDSMSLEGDWTDDPRLRLNFHRDNRLAWINAFRAFVAVIFTGAFWIVTAWPSGASAVIFVGVVCSLFSTLPRPDLAGMLFFWGTAAGACLAFPFIYVALQRVDGQFVMLALAFGCVMIPGAVMAALPRTNLFGFAFAVNFLAAVAPTNPMSYNVVHFLNNTIALVVGVMFGSLSYKLIMPPDILAAHRYVRYRIRRAFEILALHEPVPPSIGWKTRMFDRVNRLYVSAEALGAERNVWMETGLRALHFGNGILRLREMLATGKLSKEASSMVQSILGSIGWFTVSPHISYLFVRSGVETLQHTAVPTDPETRLAFIRTLGALEEMDRFCERHPEYMKLK